MGQLMGDWGKGTPTTYSGGAKEKLLVGAAVVKMPTVTEAKEFK